MGAKPAGKSDRMYLFRVPIHTNACLSQGVCAQCVAQREIQNAVLLKELPLSSVSLQPMPSSGSPRSGKRMLGMALGSCGVCELGSFSSVWDPSRIPGGIYKTPGM